MISVKSFQVDHTKLKAGVYLRDEIKIWNIYPIRIWDIRFVAPSDYHYVHANVSHTLEHLFAQSLRAVPKFGPKVISVNMMGCGTGMYVETMGFVKREDVISAMKDALLFIGEIDSATDIPGLNEVQCGNPLRFSIKYTNQWLKTISTMLNDENSNLLPDAAGEG